MVIPPYSYSTLWFVDFMLIPLYGYSTLWFVDYMAVLLYGSPYTAYSLIGFDEVLRTSTEQQLKGLD
jgi:hypothetical protein